MVPEEVAVALGVTGVTRMVPEEVAVALGVAGMFVIIPIMLPPEVAVDEGPATIVQIILPPEVAVDEGLAGTFVIVAIAPAEQVAAAEGLTGVPVIVAIAPPEQVAAAEVTMEEIVAMTPAELVEVDDAVPEVPEGLIGVARAPPVLIAEPAGVPATGTKLVVPIAVLSVSASPIALAQVPSNTIVGVQLTPHG